MSNPLKWYQQSGPDGDVVISTRIRLARNLSDRAFPNSLTPQQRSEIAESFHQVSQELPAELEYLDMTQMPSYCPAALVERHLISPAFARCEQGSALLLSPDESISLMINEEDHLRLQVMCPGLDLDEAFRLADELDTALDNKLHFAFDDRLGYLTQCPTNLGTAMRASLMMHLPALQERGALAQLANTVSKLGLTIRGLYGEGSQSEGAIYQLSNQVTLGISESAAIENLKGIAAQIIREERNARQKLAESPAFEDRIWRSLGILRTARLLSNNEFMSLISHVRTGVALQLFDQPDQSVLIGLMNDVQPACLMLNAGKELDASERDALRARIVRERLN